MLSSDSLSKSQIVNAPLKSGVSAGQWGGGAGQRGAGVSMKPMAGTENSKRSGGFSR